MVGRGIEVISDNISEHSIVNFIEGKADRKIKGENIMWLKYEGGGSDTINEFELAIC